MKLWVNMVSNFHRDELFIATGSKIIWSTDIIV